MLYAPAGAYCRGAHTLSQRRRRPPANAPHRAYTIATKSSSAVRGSESPDFIFLSTSYAFISIWRSRETVYR